MQVGEELCDKYLKGDYQYVLAVHNDKSHIHCHIIFNNTNLYNGLSFTTEHNQGRKNERAWAELREISDGICKEYGLSVIEPKGKGVSHFERDMQLQGKSWKDKLRSMLREIISYSSSFEDFLKNCTDSGIEYVYTPQNKVKLKFRLSGEGQQRFTRADTLGDEFEPENIKKTIERALIKERIQNHFGKYLTSTKPTITPTTPTEAKPEYVYKPPTQEEFERVFGAAPDTANKPVTAPKPTESKAPEKKEDPWAPIRGMGKADEIIAALEAVGITSYTEFTSYMFSSHHENDHTEKLAELNAHIKAVSSIIAKMKHYNELLPTYNEYVGLSGWSQSRYRKKHSEEIEDFKQTRAYIKEHSTKYTSDGSQPSMKDLQGLLKRMKVERDALLPEHEAFLAKNAVAKQYTRAVRNYKNEQTNRQAAEKSRQRKLGLQKKKDYLE